MTKLFIENANKGAGAQVRIYPLDENSQVIAPDSFTSMDDLGLSFGIALQPRPAIECVGSIPRTGGMVILGDGPYTVMSAEDTQEVTTLDAMLEVLNAVPGFRVDVLPRWRKPEIVCNGGENSTPWLNSSENSNMELWIDGELVASDVFFGRRYTLNGPIDGTMELTNLLLEYDIQLDVEETNLEA